MRLNSVTVGRTLPMKLGHPPIPRLARIHAGQNTGQVVVVGRDEELMTRRRLGRAAVRRQEGSRRMERIDAEHECRNAESRGAVQVLFDGRAARSLLSERLRAKPSFP